MQLVYTDVLYILTLQPTLNRTIRTHVVDTVLGASNYSNNYGTKWKINIMGDAYFCDYLQQLSTNFTAYVNTSLYRLWTFPSKIFYKEDISYDQVGTYNSIL